MRKTILIAVLLSLFPLAFSSQSVFADTCQKTVTTIPTTPTAINNSTLTISVNLKGCGYTGNKFKTQVDCGAKGLKDIPTGNITYEGGDSSKPVETLTQTYTRADDNTCEFHTTPIGKPHNITIYDNSSGSATQITTGSYDVVPFACDLKISQGTKTPANYLQIPYQDRNQPIKYIDPFSSLSGLAREARVTGPSVDQVINTGSLNISKFSSGQTYNVRYTLSYTTTLSMCNASFTILDPSQTPNPAGATPGPASKTQCDSCGYCGPQPPDPPLTDDCHICMNGTGSFSANGPGSWTALGCIPSSPDKLATWVLETSINVVGGIGFLLILFGILKIITSSGNPEGLNEGKEIIFAAIAGLIFIILSVIILKIIAGDILQIPGFS